MSQLPDSHEKDYLELLKPYVSEDTKKFRRNTVVASFIILSIYFLGKSLTEIKVAGLDLFGSSNDSVLILAMVMLTFWLIMYLIYYRRDSEIQKEQQHLLMKHVEVLKEQLDSFEEEINAAMEENRGIRSQLRHNHTSATNNYDVYMNQSSRTNKAGILNSVINKTELLLPIIIATFTILILFVEYCFAYKIL